MQPSELGNQTGQRSLHGLELDHQNPIPNAENKKKSFLSTQTLMLKARLNPDAKKPPKGAIMEANMASGMECNTAGYIDTVAPSPNCEIKSYNHTFTE